MVSKGHFVGLDWNRVTRLLSEVTGTYMVADNCNSFFFPYFSSKLK